MVLDVERDLEERDRDRDSESEIFRFRPPPILPSWLSRSFRTLHNRKSYFLLFSSLGDPDWHVLGLPDPDPLVRDTDPDLAPAPSLFS